MTISIELTDKTLRLMRRKAAGLGISVDRLASEIVEQGVKLVALGIADEGSAENGTSGTERRPRPARVKLTAEESLRRMNDFDKRRDQFIASIRKSTG